MSPIPITTRSRSCRSASGRAAPTPATRDRGVRDGDRRQARFNEPGGISSTSRELFVADTNNHLIRRIDLASGNVSTVELKGLERLNQHVARRFRGRPVALPAVNAGSRQPPRSLSPSSCPRATSTTRALRSILAGSSSDEKTLRPDSEGECPQFHRAKISARDSG
jgi:hypothetical protein